MVQELRQTHSAVQDSNVPLLSVCAGVLLIGDDNCSTWPTTQNVIKKCQWSGKEYDGNGQQSHTHTFNGGTCRWLAKSNVGQQIIRRQQQTTSTLAVIVAKNNSRSSLDQWGVFQMPTGNKRKCYWPTLTVANQRWCGVLVPTYNQLPTTTGNVAIKNNKKNTSVSIMQLPIVRVARQQMRTLIARTHQTATLP